MLNERTVNKFPEWNYTNWNFSLEKYAPYYRGEYFYTVHNIAT